MGCRGVIGDIGHWRTSGSGSARRFRGSPENRGFPDPESERRCSMADMVNGYEIRWAEDKDWIPAMHMIWKTFLKYEAVDYTEEGISRYKRDYSKTYGQTDLVLYQKYTYEDVCRLLNWEQNEVPLNIGGYKFDKKTKTFPVFINYDKAENISDTTRYEDHFVPGFRDRLIAISKSGRSMQSEDVQNFLKAKERGIQVELFVRKNKDDKISKEFYYLGHMTASGNAKEFTMANTEKTAVEIEWILDVPVREDIYEYIVNA